ncbi:MAG: FdhF/YdeP family oxidoreductase [Kofleriaceae bacterium]
MTDRGKPPILGEVELAALPRAAGGLGALASTVRFLARDTGLVRGGRTLLHMNQADGFDCPGCAWPEPGPGDRSRFEFCENGAKALAEEATTARATPEVVGGRTLAELRALTDFELGQLGRLTEPMLYDADVDGERYHPITWDAAIALLADELRALGPAATALYTSGRTSNEAAFLYQLVGRWWGTNNFPDCSNLCHESSGAALGATLGVGKGSVGLDDFDHADLILVLGQNPGTNHPRMLSTLREAARRGATIVSVNPMREVGLARFAHPQAPLELLGRSTALAAEVVQVQIGGDLAALLAIGKAVLEREDAAPGTVLDQAFLDEHTEGFAAWAAHVRALAWPDLVRGAGIDEATLRRTADRYVAADATIACWAMGLTQHAHAVATIQEVVNLLLLRGNIGRRGAGACPVRGHSNVQGDRTMGIDHHPKPALLDALAAEFGFAPPRAGGLDVVGTLEAMHAGTVRALVCLGGNFLSAAPDTHGTAAALEGCAITASVSTKLNRTHLHPGRRALILPCLARSEVDAQAGGEQFVTVEDSMSIVHASRGVLPPASPHLRSEPAIVCALGAALLGDVLPWAELAADYDRVRAHISRVIPGFDDFAARVRVPGGFQLPNDARDRSFTAVGGRARFTISTPPDLTLPPGHLRMMTIRSHDQYNTTIYGLDDRYRGVRGERRVVFVHPDDLEALGLVERQLVTIESTWDGQVRRAEGFRCVAHELPRGNCASYFPEANAVVPRGAVAVGSNTPASKSVVVRLVPETADDA